MEKIIGTTRVVFVGKKNVIKFPKINLKLIKDAVVSDISSFVKFSKRDGFKNHFLRFMKNRKKLSRGLKESARKKNLLKGLKFLPHRKYEFLALNQFIWGGIMANWNEFIFFLKTKKPFLLPTYFSFFGLINIQKKGEILEWDSEQFFSYLQKNSKQRDQIFCDAHSFENPANFCLDKGKLKVVDYGSRHCRSFINENWEQIQKNFPRPSKE